MLEQYGRPVDVLAEPSGPFVLEFLGAAAGVEAARADSGVDRRALLPGPTVEPRSADREHRARSWITARADWVTVLDQGTAAGLGRGRGPRGSPHLIDEIELHALSQWWCRPTDSLRQGASTRWVVRRGGRIVVDADDRYLGLLDVAKIGKGLAR